MQGIYDYGAGISAIDAVYDGRAQQTAILVIVERGRAAIIDTGTSHAAGRVLDALARRGVPAEAVDYVILTHVHLDHAGGAGRLMARCPNAVLTVHPRGRRHMEDPGRLVAATVAIYGEEAMRRVYGEILPVPATRILDTGEGAAISLAGRRLDFLDTPGHARHHVVVHDQQTGHVFAGDTFGLSYRALDQGGRQFSFPTTSPSQFDPAALHQSVDRILDLRPDAVYVTHFGQVREPRRVASDLHRLIDALAELGLRQREPGPQRQLRLAQGVRDILLEEARQQQWSLTKEALIDVFALDIELNAQGIAMWLDSIHQGGGSAQPEHSGKSVPRVGAKIPSEKR